MFRKTSFGYAPVSGDPVNAPYLFLLEALGHDEVAEGRNAVGATGKIFNQLLIKNTPILRSEQCVANAVRCRPVAWGADGKPMLHDNGDHVNQKPSPGQVRECATRYTDALVAGFQGKVIVALGKVPLNYMTDRPLRMGQYSGTIFEPGKLKSCEVCNGNGQNEGRSRVCTVCRGRGITRNCLEHARARRGCERCDRTPCETCAQTGKVPGPPKPCSACEGVGVVPDDPKNPYVCAKLKPGQLLFTTYHPAWLAHQPTQWPLVRRHFSRLAHLEDELGAVVGTVYDEYPPPGFAREPALLEARTVSLDLETTGLVATEGDILCVGATHEPFYGCALSPGDGRVPALLSRPRIVGQNFVLFDWWWLHHHGFAIPDATEIWDTRFAGKLLNPDTPNDLSYLTGEFAKPPIRGYWKTRENYRDRKEQVCCIDVDATLRVQHGQVAALEDSGQLGLMEKYLMPLSRVVFKMRVGGMRIDKARMSDACRALEGELGDTRLLLPDWGGVHSENQHARVQYQLYTGFDLPVQKKRDSGKPTSDSEALVELQARLETNHRSVHHLDDETTGRALEFVQRIQYLRGLSKLSNAFLHYRLSPQDTIHPELNPCGAGTFRFTCQDPNAQQVPDCTCGLKEKACKAQCEFARRNEKCAGKCSTCRGARFIFIPDAPGWELMSVDVRQAEICGFLWIAEEWAVLDQVLRQGLDAHTAIAAKILGRAPTKAERADYKTTTFALLFGEYEKTTAARLHLPVADVRAAREYYFKMLPGVPDFRKRILQEVRDRGYVTSPAGIRRYIYLDRDTGRAANQACNHPIQNIPPMMIGEAMIRIDRELPPPARMIMQVHDELLLTYPRELFQQVLNCVWTNLRHPVSWLPSAPVGMAGGLVFNLDVEIGPNWGEMHKLEVA